MYFPEEGNSNYCQWTVLEPALKNGFPKHHFFLLKLTAREATDSSLLFSSELELLLPKPVGGKGHLLLLSSHSVPFSLHLDLLQNLWLSLNIAEAIHLAAVWPQEHRSFSHRLCPLCKEVKAKQWTNLNVTSLSPRIIHGYIVKTLCFTMVFFAIALGHR